MINFLTGMKGEFLMLDFSHRYSEAFNLGVIEGEI